MTLFNLTKKKTDEPELSIGELTAQQFVNVKNIQNRFLFDKNGMVYMYIEITPLVKELLTEKEQMLAADTIKEYLKEEHEPFTLFKLQKSVDVSRINNRLFDLKQTIGSGDIADQRRKELISIDMDYLDKVATDNTTVSSVFYIKIWDSQKEIERLSKRAKNLANKYTLAGMPAHVLEQREIIAMCSLFTNPATANVDDNTYKDMYLSGIIPKMKGSEN